MRNAQRDMRVLLDEQHRHALLAVDALDDGEDVFHDEWREAQRGFVQQHQARLADQRAGDGQHLLFTAREIAGELLAPLLQARKVAVGLLGVDRAAARQRVARGNEVFFDREVGEDVPPLAHMRQSRAGQLVRHTAGDVVAEEADAACGDDAVLVGQHAACRLERAGLARAVAAQQGNDLAFGHLDRHAAQRLHAVVVDDLDVLDGQRGGHRGNLKSLVESPQTLIQPLDGSMACFFAS